MFEVSADKGHFGLADDASLKISYLGRLDTKISENMRETNAENNLSKAFAMLNNFQFELEGFVGRL